METWPTKKQEINKSESPRAEAVIQALEILCAKDEQYARTRENLIQTYPDAFKRAKNILEQKA